jgi:transposase-like protein
MKALNKLISHLKAKKSPVSRPSSDDEQSSHSSYHPNPKKRSNENVKMEDREQAVQYCQNKDGKKRYGLATVRRRFRFVWSERQLYRWKRQIERQDAPLQLTKKTVYVRLYAEFTEARQNKCSVNDSDLRDWAINIAN